MLKRAPRRLASRRHTEAVSLSPCHLVTLSCTAVLLAADSAHAHDLLAECKLKGGTVIVEAFFSDNTPAREAKVTVRDARGGELASGRTDDAGRWSFPAPVAG